MIDPDAGQPETRLHLPTGAALITLLGYLQAQAGEAVDDTLKRLLDAEMRAEKLAQDAEAEQERLIQEAMREARSEDERFTARVPEMHRAFIGKAEERAEQTVAELKRRYDERHVQLRNMAEQREQDALEASFALLIDPRL